MKSKQCDSKKHCSIQKHEHHHEHNHENETNKLDIILYIISIIVFILSFIPLFAEYKIWFCLVVILLSGYKLIIDGIEKNELYIVKEHEIDLVSYGKELLIDDILKKMED